MTVKIFDTCCLITLFESITSIEVADCCGDYDLVVTPKIQEEFGAGLPDNINIQESLSEPGSVFLKEYRNVFPGLHEGELTAMALAVSLNEETDTNVVLVMDDQTGLSKFQEIRRIPDIRERFPCIDKIITTGSIGFLKKLIREGMIDKGYISGVVD
ncbi:MAG: hypothetical protein NT131_00005, partial [Methanomassiliicoccales archaeon]|nr:hypothetical protein [Methanomassiliicoccales archaeon]